MKSCELCKSPARMYCDSDQASLCWSCDLKVHGANFLVARHSRCLLCHVCQSPTPWKASGARIGPTVTICEKCFAGEVTESEGGNGDEIDVEDEEFDDDDGGSESDEEEEEEEDEGENQVVPAAPEPVPPATSSSSSEESSSCGSFSGYRVSPRSATAIPLKRARGSSSDLRFPEEDVSEMSPRRETTMAVTLNDTGGDCTGYPRAVKQRRIEPIQDRACIVMQSMARIEEEIATGGNVAAIAGLCKLIRDPGTADLGEERSSFM